jgi:hypothetical protein
MQVIFESRDPAGAQLRELVEQRVRFVIRRLAWLVPRAKVRLTDVNGPRGGVDKLCQLELKTDHAGTVSITSLAQDWRSALETALGRAHAVLLKNAQRRRQHRRVRPMIIDTDE